MLSPEYTARYSRHLRLPGFEAEHQQRLSDARVLIVGMGGLGSPVALYLAAAGVGTLGLADFDTVERHNLQRQILHGDDFVGRPKLESAQQRIAALNHATNIKVHPEGVTCDHAIELFSNYDLIVDGSDNFPTRYLNNDAAYFARKPLVYGSVFQYEGQVSVFDPGNGGPCYRCLFPEMPAPGTVPNCDQAGVLGALCGIIGSYQALEAIKWLTGIGELLRGRLLVVDSLAMTQRTLQLKPDPECPLCGSHPRIKSIEPANYQFTCEPEPPMKPNELSSEIDVHVARQCIETHPEAILLDVREDFEVAICRIDGARHIPMGQIGERLDELPKDKPLLVYCHHGMRSLRVTEALRQRGYPLAQSIRGGIDQWAIEHAPEMTRY